MESTWNRTVLVYMGDMRSPAATPSLSDYFPIDGRVLHETKEKQIFEHAALVPHTDELEVDLGHLILEDPSGRVRFACQVQSRSALFDRIELSFEGVGVSEDGANPSMTVDSPCRAGRDPMHLTPVLLPMSRIYESVPQARHLELPGMGDTAVRLDDLASVWPENWALVRVRLYRSDDQTTSLILKPRPEASSDGLSFRWIKH